MPRKRDRDGQIGRGSANDEVIVAVDENSHHVSSIFSLEGPVVGQFDPPPIHGPHRRRGSRPQNEIRAMGAAGIPIPDKATIDALIHTFAVESNAATDWTVDRAARALSASMLPELPMAGRPGEAREYRLIVSCNTAADNGALRLAWSPLPKGGTLSASTDGQTAAHYPVEGKEKMGNGSGVVTSGLASLVLTDASRLPAESLTVGDHFPAKPSCFRLQTCPRRRAASSEPASTRPQPVRQQPGKSDKFFPVRGRVREPMIEPAIDHQISPDRIRHRP